MSSLNRIPLYLITFWIAQPETGRSLFSFMFSKSCLRWERHVCQVWTFKLLPFLTKLCTKALWLHLLLTWGKNMLIHSYALQKLLKGFLFSKQILCQEAGHITCGQRGSRSPKRLCLYSGHFPSFSPILMLVTWKVDRRSSLRASRKHCWKSWHRRWLVGGRLQWNEGCWDAFHPGELTEALVCAALRQRVIPYRRSQGQPHALGSEDRALQGGCVY